MSDSIEGDAASEVAEVASWLSHATFIDATDIEGSAFYAAPGLTPEETWGQLIVRVAEVAAGAIISALNGQDLRPNHIRDWHKQIFGDLFPERAGRFIVGKDRSEYEITLGTAKNPVSQVQPGTQGRYIPERIGKICGELNESVARVRSDENRRLRDATFAAARFYCKLLSCHPFEDGNGRVGYVALQHALVSLGLTGVALPDPDEHAIALGRGMRRDGQQSYEPFAMLLEDKIRGSA